MGDDMTDLRPRVSESSDINFLHEIGSHIAAAGPLQQVLTQIVEFVTAIVTCDSCFIYVLEKRELVLRASKNPHPGIVDQLSLHMGQGITGWVAQHKLPVAVTQNASDDARFQFFNELPEDRFEGFLSVPILCRGRVIGVINLQHREPYEYSQREIRLISTIGYLVGAEIEMARLELENALLSSQLDTRKTVERAKGILQRDLGLDEEGAYLTLRRQSRQLRRSMKEVAEAIVLGEEVRRSLKDSET